MIAALIAQKIGMTTLIDENQRAQAVTMLAVADNTVVRILKNDQRAKVQLGYGKVRSKLHPKSVRGQMRLKDAEQVYKMLAEFPIENAEQVKVDEKITAKNFNIGDRLKISGVSKGKGFQGGIKRHGFQGGRASHGSSFHRALGSTGNRSTPGRVFKGRKMAGQMGNKRVSIKNVKIGAIDEEHDLIFVLGAVPGARKSLVRIERISSTLNKEGHN